MFQPLESTPEPRDLLEHLCEEIWSEIRALMPRYRTLVQMGTRRDASEGIELHQLSQRIYLLRRRSLRYRTVLRDEAWRAHDAPGPRARTKLVRLRAMQDDEDVDVEA